jgi:hypothetical protein
MEVLKMWIILASLKLAYRIGLKEQERIFIHFLVQNLNKYNMLKNINTFCTR